MAVLISFAGDVKRNMTVLVILNPITLYRLAAVVLQTVSPGSTRQPMLPQPSRQLSIT